MSPNLEDPSSYSPELEPQTEHIQLTLTPLSDSSPSTYSSEDRSSINSESNEEALRDDVNDEGIYVALRTYIPLEHNFRELLVRVSNTEHLEAVTQIKLRVIARELALQQLGTYLPALRELILDGSIISSLRDLGNGMRNLKILRVNRCQLTCIDGVFGFEFLEELYAADNSIKDLSPCAFLTKLKVVDMRRNSIKHFGSLNFLGFCPDLTHLLIDGNEITDKLAGYRSLIGRLLPQLQMVDGERLQRDTTEASREDISIEDLEESDDQDDGSELNEIPERMIFANSRLPRPNVGRPEGSSGFVVQFPPKVCGSNARST